MNEPDPGATALRFGGQNSAESLRKELNLAARVHRSRNLDGGGHGHRLSVWADVSRNSESQTELHLRLITAAKLNNLNLRTNRRYWHFTVSQWTSLAIQVNKDRTPDEDEVHYSADFGPDPAEQTLLDAASILVGPTSLTPIIRKFAEEEGSGHAKRGDQP